MPILNTMEQDAIQVEKRTLGSKLRDLFGLERNIAVMGLMLFLLSAGEELWARFLPKYLETLGASIVIIGLFGSTRDLLDAAYQYPSGYISDRIGSQRSLILFCALSTVGYAIYLLTPHWSLVFAGLAFVMMSPRLTPPAMFAMVAEHLPYNRRVMAFSIIAVLKRVPEMFAPVIGALLIVRMGLSYGIRVSLIITIALTGIAILVQRHFYIPVKERTVFVTYGLRQQLRMGTALQRLLVSYILVKWCERMVNVFIVIYLMNVLGRTALEVGILVAIQKAATMVGYIPTAWLADRYSRKQFVIISFVCYSLFPLALVLSHSFNALVFAFIISGFKQGGEPARKAILVDLTERARRGRTVGLYYVQSSLATAPAAIIGGLLWNIKPVIPFFVACCLGLLGTALFIISPDKRADSETLEKELAI